MNTVPSVDDLLEGFIIAINNEIMPFLNNPKAVATAAMMQSLLQEVRQVFSDLDVLQRAGETKADEALLRLREFLMPTIVNHVAATSVGGGMVGRG